MPSLFFVSLFWHYFHKSSFSFVFEIQEFCLCLNKVILPLSGAMLLCLIGFILNCLLLCLVLFCSSVQCLFQLSATQFSVLTMAACLLFLCASCQGHMLNRFQIECVENGEGNPSYHFCSVGCFSRCWDFKQIYCLLKKKKNKTNRNIIDFVIFP